MKTKISPKTYVNPPVSLPITSAELIAFSVPQSAIDAGEMRGQMTHRGPWQIVTGFRALAVSAVWGDNRSPCVSQRLSETIYGIRSLSKPKEAGYVLEGYVSIKGRKVSAFTSSQMFTVTDKRRADGSEWLVNVATIHARLNA